MIQIQANLFRYMYLLLRSHTADIPTLKDSSLRIRNMQYVIQSIKTNAGKRQIPITEDVARCFQAIIEDRGKPKKEQFVDGYCGFLYFDEDGMPLVALHWEHRFNRMVKKYNEIYRVQMPNITPHVCRHTYCSNQAKAGMNPKTLQYLMGHSEISVTIPVPNSNIKPTAVPTDNNKLYESDTIR